VSGAAAPGAAPGAPGPGGWLALRGAEGLLRGEILLLVAGQEATVGRGSGSTLALTRSAGYRALSADPVRLRQACQGVSRVHFRVKVPADGEAVVEDLSRAGTFVDGRRITEPTRLRDLRDRAHELRFGREEALELLWIPARAAASAGPGA
jgi:hypothetical protein